MKLVIAEKPSVAQSLARVIGADKCQDGYGTSVASHLYYQPDLCRNRSEDGPVSGGS